MALRVSYVVGRLDRVICRRLGAALAPYGLTVAEYTTLSVLASRGGLSNAQLARRALITPQAMSEVLARLERRRLVQRETDATHARIRRTELTQAGARLLEAADDDVDRVEQELLGILRATERRRLGSLLTAWLSGLGPVD